MKELIGVLVLATSFTCLAQVSIGTPTPHPSAALEINSTTKGFLLPRMTELQMISINGQVVKKYLNAERLLDVTALSKGIYILKIEMADGAQVNKKIIVFR